ncbi:11534_t:CDS:2 [Entrophospora sp. SA101]|nr:11534_t:CDS:2 [Entrophospora sp. SA101]CAJ0849152.1 891_t:CDS:2 [Entrophospora sp. SA101]
MSSQKHKPQLIAVGRKINMSVQLELNETKFIIHAVNRNNNTSFLNSLFPAKSPIISDSQI